MSKKHFQAIAKAIREQYDQTADGSEARERLDKLTLAVAGICRHDNPRFDWDRFMFAATGRS